MARTFPNDLCKYSRNIASNDFCNINNAGWDIDANIIHGKSIIPRSASLNMTIDMFGQSVNLFEVDIFKFKIFFHFILTFDTKKKNRSESALRILSVCLRTSWAPMVSSRRKAFPAFWRRLSIRSR